MQPPQRLSWPLLLGISALGLMVLYLARGQLGARTNFDDLKAAASSSEGSHDLPWAYDTQRDSRNLGLTDKQCDVRRPTVVCSVRD